MRRIPSVGFDDQLIIAAKAGDKIAYGRLVKYHQSPLRGFLRQLTRHDFSLADDLAQDTFMLAFKKINSFKQESTFKSWLTSIAYKLFLQYIRKDKRRKNLMEMFQDIDHEPYENSPDVRIDIESALAHLKFEERSALTLNHQQGMSHSEISEVMQMPLGTIKSHIARGRENLKILLTTTSARRPS